MGSYNKGILGPFSGKVGTVVGANWRGKDIMRSLPKRGTHAPTEVQQLQRLKFLAVNQFLTPINPVLGRYYGSNTGDKTRINQAMSYHLKEAVNYVAPNFEILFNKVQISKGDLVGVQNPTIAAVGGTDVKLDWEDNSGQAGASGNDRLVVVMYEPASGLYYYSLNAETRAAISTTITLPTYFAGFEVHSWITFAAADEKKYATSIYLGSVTLP
ncbi:DUF6266 family protein [Flavobacterium sp.]|uniref:DUF6266 family protein n=1 Tax=Flavobacterium sp. TaxID=239 RepID=UPI002FD90A84